MFQRLGLRSEIDVIRIRIDIAAAALLRHHSPNHYQLIRVRERQRFQKDGVDDAEDRGVRPNPEGKSQDRDEGERGMFDELAESVTDVVDHILF